jgi:hypothetical protein
MAAHGTPVTGYSFPKVARLGQLGRDAAAKLGEACAQLRASGAPHAAGRTAGIDTHVDVLDYPSLEKLADPELAADELANARQRPVRRAHTWRNAFALLPLLITWIALGLASLAYRTELAKHPGDATKPFLLLWQQGFGSRFPSFAEVAFVDFGLLLVVLLMTGWVHWTEGRAAKSRTGAMESLYTAMDALEVAVEHSTVRPPASAEDWANAAKKILTEAREETKQLSETSREAIERASAALAGIQEQGREFIGKFSAEIGQTLAAVRNDNEQFIIRTAKETRETLQRLVEQQMEPLLNKLSQMLTEFGRHQETYRTGVADLAQGVNSIRGSAQELADSAQAYNRIADAIDRDLGKMAASQEAFAVRMTTSAEGLKTAATAMGEVKDVLQRDLRDCMRQMAANVTDASRDLAAVQRNLTATTSALSDSASAMTKVTSELRAAATWLRSSRPSRTPSRIRRLWRSIWRR